MTAAHRCAWTGAAVAVLLLVLSLSGDGTGILRNGRLAHPGWSYGLVLTLAILLVTLAGRDPKVDSR